MIKRARDKNLIAVEQVNIRDFAKGKHCKVDDRPFGGGPGMVLMPEPVVEAVQSVKKDHSHVICLSPQGKPLTAKRCRELAEKKHLVLLCGHYEGIDQRAIDLVVDEEISIGDFVLTSGGPAAIALVDAVARFVPGVLGHPEAANFDSFEQEGIFDDPKYTTPLTYKTLQVPEILRSGHHKKIAKWRKEQALNKTVRVRPDLAKGERS